MSGCEPVEAYLGWLADAGFVDVRCLGPTDFFTSAATRGHDFVATKPRRAASTVKLVQLAGAAALVAAVVVAVHRARCSI